MDINLDRHRIYKMENMDINLISYKQDVEYGYKLDIVYTRCRIWI